MRKILKCLILTLVSVLIFQTGAFALDYPDIPADASYRGVIVDLYNFGVIKDDPARDFGFENNVTRAEFAEILARAAGLDALQSGGVHQIFNDVPSSHPQAAAIEALWNHRIIAGYSDNSFRPDDDMLLEHALKAVVNTLGYKNYADARGGYPIGYLAVANSTGLLRGITGKHEAEISKKDMAHLIHNALFVNLFEETVYGDNLKMRENKSTTLMNNGLKLYKGTGIVEDTGISGLHGESTVSRSKIVIGGTIYDDASVNGKQMLGRRTEFYYRQDDEEITATVIYIKADKGAESVTVNSGDIIDFKDFALSYSTASGRTSLHHISPLADVIFNGKVLNYSVNDILFKDDAGVTNRFGTVELIDNDSDGIYEVVDVRSYENIIVDMIAPATDMKIYGKNSKFIELNADTMVTLKDTRGREIRYENLREWDILTVSNSKDAKYIDIIVSAESVVGTVTEIREGQSGQYFITIEDSKGAVEYELTPACGYYNPSMSATDIGITVGDSAYYGLDAFNKIALVINRTPINILQYGCLVDYVIMPSLNQTIEAKLLTQDNAMVIYQFADKVTIDNKRYADKNEMINRLVDVAKNYNGVDIDGAPDRKEIMVRYALNADDKICEIDTPYALSPEQGESEQSLFMYCLQPDNPPISRVTDRSELIYRGRTFAGKIAVTDNIPVFYIPPAGATLDENYMVMPVSKLVNDKLHIFRAFASNTDRQIPEAILIYGSPIYYAKGATIEKHSLISVYLKKSMAVDEDGKITPRILVARDGQEIGVNLESANIPNFESLTPGDIIRYGTNSHDRINAIDIVYKYDENRLPREGLENQTILRQFTEGYSRIVFGAVYAKDQNVLAFVNQIKAYRDGVIEPDDNGILVNLDLGNLNYEDKINLERHHADRYQIFAYDPVENKVKRLNYSEVLTYTDSPSDFSYAVVYSSDYNPRTIIIYKSNDINWR